MSTLCTVIKQPLIAAKQHVLAADATGSKREQDG